MVVKIVKSCFFPVLIMITSCGSKQGKDNWSQKEKVQYMRDCIQSARNSMTERGMQPDSTIITTLCKCAGEIIEERYDYKEASGIKHEEINDIMQQAVEKCLNK